MTSATVTCDSCSESRFSTLSNALFLSHFSESLAIDVLLSSDEPQYATCALVHTHVCVLGGGSGQVNDRKIALKRRQSAPTHTHTYTPTHTYTHARTWSRVLAVRSSAVRYAKVASARACFGSIPKKKKKRKRKRVSGKGNCR